MPRMSGWCSSSAARKFSTGLLIPSVDPLLARLTAEKILGISIAEAAFVDVADGEDLDVVVFQEDRQVDFALVA